MQYSYFLKEIWHYTPMLDFYFYVITFGRITLRPVNDIIMQYQICTFIDLGNVNASVKAILNFDTRVGHLSYTETCVTRICSKTPTGLAETHIQPPRIITKNPLVIPNTSPIPNPHNISSPRTHSFSYVSMYILHSMCMGSRSKGPTPLTDTKLKQRPYIIETVHSYTLPMYTYLGCTYPC